MTVGSIVVHVDVSAQTLAQLLTEHRWITADASDFKALQKKFAWTIARTIFTATHARSRVMVEQLLVDIRARLRTSVSMDQNILWYPTTLVLGTGALRMDDSARAAKGQGVW